MVGQRTVKHFTALIACGLVSLMITLLLGNKEWRLLYMTKEIDRLKEITQPTSNNGSRMSVRLPHNKQRVVIMAYMHTGSTFMGSVLQQMPGTFYEYEPIRSNLHRYKNEMPMRFMNGTAMLIKDFTEFEKEMLQHRLRCDHGDLDLASLSVLYHKINSDINRDRRDFMNCHGYVSEKNENEPVNKTLIRKCLPLLTDRCKKAETIVHKYIRSNMNITERLLETFPNLKVIHLVRDPRAMMDSQARKNDMNSARYPFFVNNTKNMCSRMGSDIKMFPRVRERFTDRIMMVRQEDFSDYPVLVLKSVFSFLGLPIPDVIMERLLSLSSRRPAWRSHISEQNLQAVDRLCGHIYPRLGYISIANIKDVRNIAKPSYVPVNKDASNYAVPIP